MALQIANQARGRRVAARQQPAEQPAAEPALAAQRAPDLAAQRAALGESQVSGHAAGFEATHA